MTRRSESPPTPAQRRALLDAIHRGGPVKFKAGASAARMRANLLNAGWIEGGRPTETAFGALGVTARCRHGHICLVNAGHLLHPLTLDVCDLGAEGEGDDPRV